MTKQTTNQPICDRAFQHTHVYHLPLGFQRGTGNRKQETPKRQQAAALQGQGGKNSQHPRQAGNFPMNFWLFSRPSFSRRLDQKNGCPNFCGRFPKGWGVLASRFISRGRPHIFNIFRMTFHKTSTGFPQFILK
jgi:hypothetical protein